MKNKKDTKEEKEIVSTEVRKNKSDKMNKTNLFLPKVLIVAPTYDKKSELLDEWIENLNSLSYPNFDVLLVDTSLDTDNGGEYFKKLSEKKLDDVILQIEEDESNRTVFKRNIILKKHEWNPEKQHQIQMLSDAREITRKYFVDNKEYSFMFHLDSDIFIPENSIQKLISYKKHCVGFYVPIHPEDKYVPCVFKTSGIIIGKGFDYFSFEEINEYKSFVSKFKNNKLSESEKNLIPFIIENEKYPQLFKTYAVNLGCLMTSRTVMEKVQFRTHPTFIYGEDLWFFREVNDKGFEFYCDTDVMARHETTGWDMKKSSNKLGFKLAIGPENAEGIDIVDRGKKNG